MAVNMRTIFWNKCDAKTVVCKLAEGLYDVNNDFNGENGEEFTSFRAVSAGFKSDLDYVIAVILNNDKERCNRLSVENVVQIFLSELFKDDDWYESWNYEILEHPTFGTIGVSVAWTLAK